MTDTPEMGHNLSEIKRGVADAMQKVIALKTKRGDVNAEIAAVKAKVEALGVGKPAFDMALRYLEWDPEKRQGFDAAYNIAREAAGLPLQDDLFSLDNEGTTK